MTKEYEYFNCDEEHEFDFVSRQYEKHADVKKFLKRLCAKGEINNFTHDDIYILLDEWDYKKK